jgi:hypothetical protein
MITEVWLRCFRRLDPNWIWKREVIVATLCLIAERVPCSIRGANSRFGIGALHTFR